MKINDVVNAKSVQQIVTIAPDATVRELVALLGQHNIGAVIVSSDGSALDGIVSERDVVRSLKDDAEILSAPVQQIMTADVFTCESANDLDDVLGVMTEHRVRHIPVTTDGRLTGVVSIGDLVKSKIDQLQYERDQLDTYLHQT